MSSSSLWSCLMVSLTCVVSTMLWHGLHHLQLPHFLCRHSHRLSRRLAAFLDPYLTVTVAEHDGGGRIRHSEAYKEVQAYLQRATMDATGGVRHLTASPARDSDPDRLVLSMDKGEEVADVFRGATISWLASTSPPPDDDSLAHRAASRAAGRRLYRLSFLERHRDLVLGEYLPYVRREGRAAMVKDRQRKLFTNISGGSYDSDEIWSASSWSHVVFEHPKTFETLAMDPRKKKEIMTDLDAFRSGKEYYARVGKAWKRGYLLYGPPGTGKSTMVAAMANYLDYDVYDIELTSVSSNTELRKLFIETTSKSIVVIEDIDCSLDLTGKRTTSKKKKDTAAAGDGGHKKDGDRKEDDGSSKVTLSGVLNFIDGLWSACGGERIIVFTTNHVEKLDPALIRRGRMDKHIEMSYCGFEAFRFLAKVYLDVDAHHLFDDVEALLKEVDMTPADVAENLTPKGPGEDADSCLAALVEALEEAKEKALAKKKAKEEAAVARAKKAGGKEEEVADEDGDVDDD
nr:unnamed protein product [Digitaria exilis]